MTNSPFLRQISTFKNKSEHIFAKQVGKSGDSNRTKISSTYHLLELGLHSIGHLFSKFLWKEYVTQYWTLREPHSNNVYLNIKPVVTCKNDSLVAKFSKSEKSFRDILWTKVYGVWKSFLTQTSMNSYLKGCW